MKQERAFHFLEGNENRWANILKSLLCLLLTIVLLFGVFGAAFAQQNQDYLDEEYLSGLSGEERYTYLHGLSQSMIRKDERLGAEYAMMAYKYAEEINRPVLRATSALVYTYFMMGSAEADNNEIVAMLEDAEQVYTDSNDISGLINTYSNFSIFLRKESKVAEALEYALKAYELSIALNDDPQISLRARTVGIVYDQVKNHEKAIEYFQIACDAAIRFNDTFLIAGAMAGLASVYLSANEGDKAIETFLTAKQLYYSIDRPLSLLNTLSNLANAYNFVGKYDEALKTLRESIQLANELESDDQLMRTYTSASKVLIEAGQYEEAQLLLEEAELLAGAIGDQYWLSNLYQNYSSLFEAKGEYESALLYYRKHANMYGAYVSEESKKQINELEVKFQTTQKEKQIQSQQIDLEQNEHQRNMLIFGFSVVLFFAVGFGAFLFYRSRIKQDIADKELALKDERIKTLQQEQKIEIMHAIMQTQELERQRIARDLHDGLGGLLSTAQLHSSKLDRDFPESAVVKANQEIINTACQEVRKIAHNMMPDALIQLGLADTLADMVSELDAAVPDIKFHLELIEVDIFRFEKNTEIMLYRITQEAIQNILKHAEATKVLIQLSYHDNRLDLHISDNGNGMDTSADTLLDGLGLKNIANRVDYLNGELEIQSSPGEGTQVYICIPVQTLTEGSPLVALH